MPKEQRAQGLSSVYQSQAWGTWEGGGGVKIFFLGLPKEQSSQPDCETESLTEEKRRKGTEIGQGCGYNEESMNTGLFFVFISIHSWYVIVHRFYMG